MFGRAFQSSAPRPQPPAIVREDGYCRLKLGHLVIEWAECFDAPIGASLVGAWFVTLTLVRYRFGKQVFEIAAGYVFDGASIPWFMRWLPGFHKHDWHLLAALIHDFICDHPEILPRPVGDGIFVAVLLAIAAATRTDSARGRWRRELQAWAMYGAVSMYTCWRMLVGGRERRL